MNGRAVDGALRSVELADHVRRRNGGAQIRDDGPGEVAPRTEDGVVEVGDKISTCIYIAAILSDFLHQLNEELAENERRGLTSVLGFGAAPAVVVVDFTRAFTEPGDSMPLAADFSAEIEATTRVVACACRRHPGLLHRSRIRGA